MQETQEMQVRSLSREDSLEEGIAAHSSLLAWEILWETHGLRSLVGYVQRIRKSRIHLSD